MRGARLGCVSASTLPRDLVAAPTPARDLVALAAEPTARDFVASLLRASSEDLPILAVFAIFPVFRVFFVLPLVREGSPSAARLRRRSLEMLTASP